MGLPVSQIRRQFPLLSEAMEGHPLVYLDSAATTQKPDVVLQAMDTFYETANANVHRGMHGLAEAATNAYENARVTVQRFLHAQHSEEIIFTKNATEGINLVARSLGDTWRKGDAVIVSALEHHSNIVPWLQLKEEKDIDVRWADIDDIGIVSVDDIDRHLADGNVKMVAVTGQSNVLGTKPDLTHIIRKAHEAGAVVLVDAAQFAAHDTIDVQSLDCDFLVFSSHKVYGPTGIGVLYGKKELLAAMPPFLGGGMMIQEVTHSGFTSADLPQKFEAGTPPIAEAVGLASALDWLGQFSLEDRATHEQQLLKAALDMLHEVRGVRVLGPGYAEQISGCVSFTTDGVHAHDLTDLLGKRGFCLRAGHHCTQPLHARLGIPASSRLSVGIYNTEEEIRALGPAIADILTRFNA